jgi:hypothetical protein
MFTDGELRATHALRSIDNSMTFAVALGTEYSRGRHTFEPPFFAHRHGLSRFDVVATACIGKVSIPKSRETLYCVILEPKMISWIVSGKKYTSRDSCDANFLTQHHSFS